jgi:hypothetical protein
LLRDLGDHYELTGPLPPFAIPSTLHASLLARLDRLAAVKDVAQIGAVIGREFTYPLIAAVAMLSDRDLSAALAQLVAVELIFQRGVPPMLHISSSTRSCRMPPTQAWFGAGGSNCMGKLPKPLKSSFLMSWRANQKSWRTTSPPLG